MTPPIDYAGVFDADDVLDVANRHAEADVARRWLAKRMTALIRYNHNRYELTLLVNKPGRQGHSFYSTLGVSFDRSDYQASRLVLIWAPGSSHLFSNNREVVLAIQTAVEHLSATAEALPFDPACARTALAAARAEFGDD